MPSLKKWQGKLLMRNGKLATADPCCCNVTPCNPCKTTVSGVACITDVLHAMVTIPTVANGTGGLFSCMTCSSKYVGSYTLLPFIQANFPFGAAGITLHDEFCQMSLHDQSGTVPNGLPDYSLCSDDLGEGFGCCDNNGSAIPIYENSFNIRAVLEGGNDLVTTSAHQEPCLVTTNPTFWAVYIDMFCNNCVHVGGGTVTTHTFVRYQGPNIACDLPSGGWPNVIGSFTLTQDVGRSDDLICSFPSNISLLVTSI